MRTPRRDDDDTYLVYLGIGTVHNVGEADDDKGRPSGRLYVPDPEQRSGWREHYVPQKAEPKPGARPIGFGRE
jgi:hypothetical protein